jgi:uncharacterized protein YecE (DUF72 family)
MSDPTTNPAPAIRVGVGGWTFEPWRDNFFPKGLPHARELEYASRKLTAIEVNGTYYSSQKPATFAKWRDETPDDFVFSLKASRFATNRRVLAEAGDSIERFVNQGIAELREKLGPIVWQFAPTKRFEPDDFGAFLALLPAQVGGLPLRHVLDVRHESFKSPVYLALAREHRVATVFTDSDDYPSFADVTGGFVYARLMRTDAQHAEGCAPESFAALAACARTWREGGEPGGLPRVEAAPAQAAAAAPRDVFLFFISGAKEKAPAAAMALIRELGGREPRATGG